MKKHYPYLITIGIGLVIILLIIAFQSGWVTASPSRQETRSGVPSFVAYQGQIFEGTVPFDGTGYFKFAITDSMANIVWSNDGIEPPSAVVPIHVNNGLFSVNLGDTSLSGMSNSLSFETFEDPNTYLRVWFSPDGLAPWAQMPDQVIAAVPYALQSHQAMNTDFLDSLDSAAFQLLVTGSCPAGEAINQVNADGSVTCEPVQAIPEFTITTLNSSGIVGTYSAIAIGADGLGLISYFNEVSADLEVAHCRDINCSSADIYTLDSTDGVGQYTAIAIGTDGRGLISYYDITNKNLKVAHCTDITCSSANLYTIDPSAGDVGSYTSIAIGADNFGLISYFDLTNGDLKIAHCDNINCSSADISTLDSTEVVGKYSDIVIGTDDRGLISYYDSTNKNLKVAHCTDSACSSANLYTIDPSAGDVGSYTSITIGADGLGLISYSDNTNADLKVAHCNNDTCNSAVVSSFATTIADGVYTSIAIGMDGLGLISYLDYSNNDLKVAHCSSDKCREVFVSTLDSYDMIGAHNAIAIGVDGLGLISYIDGLENDLKVAHCSNNYCMPLMFGVP